MAKKRLHMTLADYVVIAISPALIMLLVGSMMFFMVTVIYGGAWEGRLRWILFCYVIGIVGVARISIEEGLERATIFGIALALAVALATIQFLGPLVLLILFFVWWATHKLTWDCTLIDDSQDASGEGLLQAAGLDPDARIEQSDIDESPPEKKTPSSTTTWKRLRRLLYFDRDQPHPPGAWVIYFALAAIPIFGIGQLLLGDADIDRRRDAFRYFVYFVASAMGLLLTTSFLGLRRYLRQRKVEMPAPMAGAWMGVGAAMILAIVLLAALLPRARPEYSLAQWAGQYDEKLRASMRAFMRDGAAEGEGAASRDTFKAGEEGRSLEGLDGSEKAGGSPEGAAPRQQQSAADNRASQDGPAPTGQQSSGESRSNSQSQQSGGETNSQSSSGDDQGGGQSSQSGGGQRQSSGSQSGQQGQGQQSQGQGQQGQGQQGQTQQGQQGQGQQGQQAQGGEPQNTQGSEGDKKDNGLGRAQQRPTNLPETPREETAQAQAPRPPASPRGSSWNFIPSLEGIVRAIGYLLFAIIIGYCLWRYWSIVVAAIKDFLEGLRDLWAALFGRKPSTHKPMAAVASEAPARRVTFADFRDPFLSGRASNMPPAELLRYSFAAMEAWAADHGRDRRQDETPLEFSFRIAEIDSALEGPARDLGRMYARIAYGNARLGPSALEPLERLWIALRTTTPPSVASSATARSPGDF